jgi:hypothetical protein
VGGSQTVRFHFDPEQAKRQEAGFSNVNDIVEFYKKTFPEKLNALKSMPAETMAETVDFFKSWHRSSRMCCRTPWTR